MIYTKTKKTALLMAEAYGPTSSPSSLALESTLSRSLEVQYGFRLKLCHQSAKTIALAGLKNLVSSSRDYTLYGKLSVRSLFFSEQCERCFFLLSG